MVVGGHLAARLGGVIRDVERGFMDNRLLDVRGHEAHHLRVGWLLKVLLLVDSLGERLVFAVENEKEWRSATQSCFLGLNGIFSFRFTKTEQLGKPTLKTRRGKNFTLNLALTFHNLLFAVLARKASFSPRLDRWACQHCSFTVFRIFHSF